MGLPASLEDEHVGQAHKHHTEFRMNTVIMPVHFGAIRADFVTKYTCMI
jgi:hypothetical protein